MVPIRLRCRHLVALLLLVIPLHGLTQGPSDRSFSNEQLDQMLAQIALYPDALLSQVLMASTYPDEFQQAVAWSKEHEDAKGDDAVKAVEGRNWDPSVASLVAFPEVLVTLGEKPDYVRNLGDAFLAQPDDVMASVQRLRAAAQKAGHLKSNDQVKVATQAPPPAPATAALATKTSSASTTVVQAPSVTQTIIIEPAQPSVVYVPTYNPAVVYGPWWYPAYPPYYYPPPAGYWWSHPVAAGITAGISFGIGVGIADALWGGFDWHHGDVNINVNRYNEINVNKRLDVKGNRTRWSHDTTHRTTAYRGGEATRERLDQQRAAVQRDAYRGRDVDRQASRQRAQSAMQQRGLDPGTGNARDRVQAMDRQGTQDRLNALDRGGQRVGGTHAYDREAAHQRAASFDRDAARERSQSASRDHAFHGVSEGNARGEFQRGSASLDRASMNGRGVGGFQGGGGHRGGGHGRGR